MNAEDCAIEARLLRACADAVQVAQNRAWLSETADDWQAVADGLTIASQMGEPAFVTFVGCLRRGQRVLRQEGSVPGFMWVRRFSRDGIAVWDDDSGQLLWINPADMKFSPIVAYGTEEL